MKNVIQLIRVSTDDQGEDDRASIPAQRTTIERTCVRYGLEIVRTIEIRDVSGASVLESPEMQQLIVLMRSPEIHGVVVREFSRLMRPENFEDYALLQKFVDTKTILYLSDGPIDLSSKTGRLMGAMQAMIAGMERTEILDRIQGAKEEKRRRGELAQGDIVLAFGIGYEEERGFFYKPETERVRTAFQQFLAGKQNYEQLSKMLGVTPHGMKIIMRNPIWTGWRVVDHKRDPSPEGKYVGVNGRQADRRKILRAPEDVIRVQVIKDPLVSIEDFEAAQHLMNLKEQRHWRTRTDYVHRFTYNGFLTCSVCGETVHTALARRDYYACKGRRVDHKCSSPYMRREELEKELDYLFGERLTDRCFIEHCVAAALKQSAQTLSDSAVHTLTTEINVLRRKRDRVIDSFVDGILTREEREGRLDTIDEGIRVAQNRLSREAEIKTLDSEHLIESFAPLAEWRFWTREQKRSVLSTLVPDIRVADCQIESLGLHPLLFSNEVTRSPAATSTTSRASACARLP